VPVRLGATCRSAYGSYTTAYNRFNRWRKAGVWDRLMDAIVKAHDGNVQMIDSSLFRVHHDDDGTPVETVKDGLGVDAIVVVAGRDQ
jgi:transposase